jgi:type IV fimbrial biogenesis protein FimT
MTAISVLAVLAAIAVPSWRDYTRNSRSEQTRVDLITANSMARMAAITRTVPVSLCASEDGEECSDDAADWSRGWIVFVDNLATPGTIDADEEIIEAFRGPGPNLIEFEVGDPAIGDDEWTFLRYLPNGEPQNAGQRQIAIQPDACEAGVERRQLIQLSAIGAVRVRTVACE